MMTTVDFYSLPRSNQDHWLDSLGGNSPPHPITVKFGHPPNAVIWLAVSSAGAALLIFAYLIGFGDPTSGLALQPLPMAALYILAAGVVVSGALNALVWRHRTSALPFKPGVYSFPANVVDARTNQLAVYPLANLAAVSQEGTTLVLAFGDRSFRFHMQSEAAVAEALAQVEAARNAGPDSDARTRFAHDPLEPPSMLSPLAPTVPLSYAAPAWLRGRWALAGVLGAVLGFGVFQLRNSRSDEHMFRQAVAEDTVSAYQAYLARGKRYSGDVTETRLPRAQLKLAMASDSVDAIDEFMRAHPNTGIGPEVQTARRNALIHEFERARDKGTLAALFGFEQRHPKHDIGPAMSHAKHSLYMRALDARRKTLPPDSEKVSEFLGRLIAYSERVGAHATPQGPHGPNVEIRFQRLASETLKRADGIAQRDPMYSGGPSLPTRYFSDEKLAKHEQALAKALISRLGQAFDPTIFTFSVGPPVPAAENDEVPPVTQPSLIISERVEWSGQTYSSKIPRGIFIGIYLFFRSWFVIPGDKQPLRGKLTLQQPIPQDVIAQNKSMSSPGGIEALAYDLMLQRSFEAEQQQLLDAWFKK